MSDQSLSNKDAALLNENATLADLKAKKERQRAAAATQLHTSASVVESASDHPDAAASQAPVKAKQPRPDRVGKVLIAGYFPAATRKALKHVAVDEGSSLQQVMADAFTHYLKSRRSRL